MEYHEILYEVRERVAIVTINRPDRMNALTVTTHRELAEAFDAADADPEIRAIVLTGEGKGFCSGDDVQDIFSNPDLAEDPQRVQLRLFEGGSLITAAGGRLPELNTPTIAAVNGAAAGYGCDLALMCHMRVASERARFGEVFLRVGLIPDEGLLMLPRLTNLGKAYELALTTDFVDAAEAERLGLVNRVVPHERLLEETLELAEKITSKPPVAVRLTIEAMRRGLGWPLEEFKRFQQLALAFCSASEDHREGVQAFLEKREPRFTGR
jgi:2-(1,2-epoxy-1,2-dihydrophenyl)acetyl-CoA isomerase